VNMMTAALVSFAFMAIAIAGMAVGVMFKRAPLAGSCGGLKKLFGAGDCEICEHKSRCEKKKNNS